MLDGGFAWIHGNTIEGLTGLGINLNENSTARIWSNIIRNNGNVGNLRWTELLGHHRGRLGG